MKHRGLLALLLLLAATSAFADFQDANGVPHALMAKLKRGVNVTRWFCYLESPSDTRHYETYFTPADFSNLKRLGVTWVRLCVAPEVLYSDSPSSGPGSNSALKPEYLPFLDRAIERLQSAGLATVLDLHDNGELHLDQPGHDNSGFVAFWQAMARHYRGVRERSLVFELLNEPQFTARPQDWYDMQQRTVTAIRAIDSKRTIMVSGTSWSGIDTLANMKPLPDRNLLYTFHCYDPFWFTHQGASWAGDPPKSLRSVPFPSSPEAVAVAIANSAPSDRSVLETYGSQRLGAAYLKSRVDKAMDWGAEHRLPVVLGEFGAYPPVSPVESRARWFVAMRDAIKARDVPNAIWGYDDALGLGRTLQPDGTIRLDPVVEESLFEVRIPK